MKALKATISGSYRDSKSELVDFENVVGYLPYVDEEHAKMHIRGRYAIMWIIAATDKAGEKLYKSRLDATHQVFIDSLEEVEHDFSYIGKDIKEMSYDELQDLATAQDLRRIPLPKQVSGVDLREMRSMAYMDYAAQVLGMDDTNRLDEKRPIPVAERINPAITGYDFAKLRPIVVGGDIRTDDRKKLTNEEVLELEAATTNLTSKPGSTLSHDDLKQIAKDKNIKFHPNIGYDGLYEKIFGTRPGQNAA